jgi:hypothetical protein
MKILPWHFDRLYQEFPFKKCFSREAWIKTTQGPSPTLLHLVCVRKSYKIICKLLQNICSLLLFFEIF